MQKGLQRSTRHSRGVGQGRFWNWCAELHREGHSGAPGPQRHTTGSSNPVLPGKLRPLEAAQPSSASGSRSPSGEQERKDRHSRDPEVLSRLPPPCPQEDAHGTRDTRHTTPLPRRPALVKSRLHEGQSRGNPSGFQENANSARASPPGLFSQRGTEELRLKVSTEPRDEAAVSKGPACPAWRRFPQTKGKGAPWHELSWGMAARLLWGMPFGQGIQAAFLTWSQFSPAYEIFFRDREDAGLTLPTNG